MKMRMLMYGGVLAFVLASAGVTRAQAACVGDCDGDLNVEVSELVTALNIALGKSGTCAGLEIDGLSIGELVQAVRSSLTKCETVPPPPTRTKTPTVTLTPTPVVTSTPTPTPTPVQPPACGDGNEDPGEECDDGGLCFGDAVCEGGNNDGDDCIAPGDCPGGACEALLCTRTGQCPGGKCRPAGGDGCAANCTEETSRSTTLDPARSYAVVQQAVLPITITLAGTQAYVTGSPRDVAVLDPQGQVVTRPGDIPAVQKITGVFFEPVRVTGLVCACVRGVLVPQFGSGNSAAGVIACGLDGLTDIDYRLVQDHNTTPGDARNGSGSSGSRQMPDDPECDTSFTFPGSGVVSNACPEGIGPTCSDPEDFHKPPEFPNNVCRSPRNVTFFGGEVPTGSALINNTIAIGLLRDGGLCLTGAAARNANGSCKFPDYGTDCTPCTNDDSDLGVPELLPETTGLATAAVFDANNVKNITIDRGGSGESCTSNSQCDPGQQCARTCVGHPNNGCQRDSQCPDGDTCGPKHCDFFCGGSPCFTSAQGARFDCQALAADPLPPGDGLSGAALAITFPANDSRTIGDNVTSAVLGLK